MNNFENKVYYGIEVSFSSNKIKKIETDLLKESDIIAGAIHHLEDYPVRFSSKKNLLFDGENLNQKVVEEINYVDRSTFFELYLITITSMLKNNNVDIWAHPFRFLGFLLIFGKDYLDYFYKEYFPDIINLLSETNIAFELNEGLNNNYIHKFGHYCLNDFQNTWDKFYSKVVSNLLKRKIPIVFGTDNHNDSSKIGKYFWVKRILKDSIKLL